MTKIYLVFDIKSWIEGLVPGQNYGNYLRFGRVPPLPVVFFITGIRLAYPALDSKDFSGDLLDRFIRHLDYRPFITVENVLSVVQLFTDKINRRIITG